MRSTSSPCRPTVPQDLYEWAPKLTAALQNEPLLADVSSDQQQNGLETDLVIDRATAARLGVTPAAIDNTLYDAFGQRQVSTIYNALNQYHVVMEVAPRYWQTPERCGTSRSARPAGPTRAAPARSNAVAGTATAAGGAANAARKRRLGPQSGDQRDRQPPASAAASTGAADSTAVETMVPLAAFSRFEPGQHAAGGQPPGHVRRHDDLLQPAARRIA